MNKNNYFTDQDFLEFLAEHGLATDMLTEQDAEEGYNKYVNPEHAEKEITFISKTILPDEDEEKEKE